MATTTADLIKAALEHLGRLGVGESVATEDSTLLTARIGKLAETLSASRVVTISNINSIDDAYAIPLSWLLAATVAQEYGLPNADDLIARYTDELASIARRKTAAGPVARILDQLAIWGVENHTIDATLADAALDDAIAELAARRVIAIDDAADIPDDALPHLVRYVAATLAPANEGMQRVRDDANAQLAKIARFGASDAVSKVLDQLAVWGVPSEAIDADRVDAAIRDAVAELSARNVIAIDDPEDIPQEALSHLVRYVAASLAPADRLPIMDQAAAELARISRMATAAPLVSKVLDCLANWGIQSLNTDADRITAALEDVIADLRERNVIYIPSIADVPDGAVMHLVEYTATLFAPPTYSERRDRAESRLRTLARLGKGIPGARLKVDRSLLGASRRQGRL